MPEFPKPESQSIPEKGQPEDRPSRRTFIKSGAGLAAAVSVIGAPQAWSAPQAYPGPAPSAVGGTGERTSLFVSAPSGDMSWIADEWNPARPFLIWGRPLRVRPILMYAVPEKREMTSWRSWGGVLTEDSAAEEVERITNELRALAGKADFPLEALPVAKVKTPEEAAQALQGEYDVVMVYPASGGGKLLQACVPPEGDALLFARHRSGPIYYWYEALSVAYLNTDKERAPGQEPPRLGKTHVDDVVIDDYDEALWRLRALYGVKNLTGARIVAVGGIMGKYAGDAPERWKAKHRLEITEIDYAEMEKRIQNAFADADRVAQAERWTDAYLKLPKTSLKTDRTFVVNAFLLYGIFKDLMREHQAPAFTIKECMSTIIPMSKTTACLTLSLLNDEGLIAFCESDYVVTPAGILLRHIAGKPVFMHNSTFPHQGLVTCAHCSAPRRMDANRYEPTTLLTHEESDFGAAPKVEIPLGQEVSFIDPEYAVGRWVGIRGNVIDNPFYPICRSQQDVKIQGQWKKLISEARDSHWMMAYGDYLQEVGYAARKMGIQWENISDV
ncbi:MAG: sugar isomerase [bacterium]